MDIASSLGDTTLHLKKETRDIQGAVFLIDANIKKLTQLRVL